MWNIYRILLKIYEFVIRASMPGVLLIFPNLWRDRKYVCLNVKSIGHLAEEFEIFIKEVSLGFAPRFRYIVVVHPLTTCNRTLLNYWKPHIEIIDSVWGYFLHYPLSRMRFFKVDAHSRICETNETNPIGRVQQEWLNREPLLAINQQHRAAARPQLEKLGLPLDTWFVCFHARESGFPNTPNQPYRNVDILTYIPAMREVVRRGGWCIRIGDSSMAKIPNLDCTIDLAHSNIKSDMLDIYFLGDCRLFVGCSSGPTSVAMAFGRHIVRTNAIPLSLLPYYGEFSLSISKLIHSKTKDRLLNFSEMINIDESHLQSLSADLQIINNTSEEVCDVVIEMLDAKFNDLQLPSFSNDMRQIRFRGLYRPGHHSFGCLGVVGSAFLTHYEFLLDEHKQSNHL
jgi:putative glycosyltransferase (TIGR04372 family)